MVNQDEESSPWTIKSFPVDLRMKAVQAAKAADQSMGEWLAEAVYQALIRQAKNGLLPPGMVLDKIEIPKIDLSGLAAAANAATAALLAAGKAPSAALGRNISTTANFYARAARGLAPVQRSAPSPAKRKKALTIAAEPKRLKGEHVDADTAQIAVHTAGSSPT